MGYRIHIYSSHKILGKKGAAFGKESDRIFILSSVHPAKSYKPYSTKAIAQKELSKQKKYDLTHNKSFKFKYKIVKE